MNITPSYPNIVPLAQQPATEAARRDSALRERIPQPAETNSGKTENRFGSSADTPPRYVTNTSVATSETYSLSSLKSSALKTTSDATLPTTETVTAASDQSQRKGQTASGDDSSESDSDQDKQKEKKEEQAIKDLKKRDTEVRTHEEAHKTAGGQFAGSPAFDMTKGPDGQSYATGGHVNIDVSAVPNDPQATINKMSQIKSAALAPAEPSSQDLKVAANADSVAAEARSELAKSSTAATNSDTAAAVSTGASAQNLSISDDPSINAQMRRRGQIILARYQSSSRPYA
jgi:hypothetical protein